MTNYSLDREGNLIVTSLNVTMEASTAMESTTRVYALTARTPPGSRRLTRERRAVSRIHPASDRKNFAIWSLRDSMKMSSGLWPRSGLRMQSAHHCRGSIGAAKTIIGCENSGPGPTAAFSSTRNRVPPDVTS
jgi:hypothetical protein